MQHKTVVPEWAREVIISTDEIVVDGETFTYYLLPAEFEPDLPGFVGFPRGEFLFASVEIPADYLPFILTHEVREFTTLAGVHGRCKTSLERELADVPGHMTADYLIYRLEFFRRLVAYYASRPDPKLADLKCEIAGSLRYLEILAG